MNTRSALPETLVIFPIKLNDRMLEKGTGNSSEWVWQFASTNAQCSYVWVLSSLSRHLTIRTCIQMGRFDITRHRTESTCHYCTAEESNPRTNTPLQLGTASKTADLPGLGKCHWHTVCLDPSYPQGSKILFHTECKTVCYLQSRSLGDRAPQLFDFHNYKNRNVMNYFIHVN